MVYNRSTTQEVLHRVRKKRTPEENARQEKIRELLHTANIGSMDDIQNLFKETIAEFPGNGLDAELDDELGYSKYDYRNKDTDNSRNGHSNKTLRTSFGDVEVSNSPLRSRGIETSTSPKLVRSVLLLWPLRLLSVSLFL